MLCPERSNNSCGSLQHHRHQTKSSTWELTQKIQCQIGIYKLGKPNCPAPLFNEQHGFIFGCWIANIEKQIVLKDLWMGTQLLVVDISCALKLVLKQFHGHEVTIRERKKLKRTLNDIITLIPVTILMLLPVSTHVP